MPGHIEEIPDIPDESFHLPPRNNYDGRTQEEIEKKVRDIYGNHITNYVLLPEYKPNLSCFNKLFLSSFLQGFTFGLYKRRYYCPRCCRRIDKFTYSYHPIYHYGCDKCRIKKED